VKLFSIKENGYPRTLLILVVIFLVAGGLCGLQLRYADEGAWGLLMPLGVVELIAMAGSAGAIIVVTLLWIGTTLYDRFGKPPKDEVQKLFGDKDDTNPDNPR
jgi:hypothetical protein